MTSGSNAGQATRVPFIVRSPESSPAAGILVIAPANTWEAYNSWGGNSLYVGTTGHPAFKVSFDRPGITDLSGLQWEYPLVAFLERQGQDVSYATDLDVDADPGELLRHRLVIVAGHSEYWTKGMRDAFEQAEALGTNLLFAGANDAYWQIRYEDNRRTIVGYKESASLDPQTDPSLKTTRFRDLVPPRPECGLMGVEYQYSSWGIPSQDYEINPRAASDPWFDGTGLTTTTSLTGLVGPEWDGVVPACAHPNETVLFYWKGSEFGKPNANAARYVAPSGAVIFATGSDQFAWGLDEDAYTSPGVFAPGLERFMENALIQMTRPASPKFIDVATTARQDVVRVGLRSRDPRVTRILVYRDYGRGASNVLTDASPVCTVTKGPCVVPRMTGRIYRFAAIAVDQETRSVPTFSRMIKP